MSDQVERLQASLLDVTRKALELKRANKKAVELMKELIEWETYNHIDNELLEKMKAFVNEQNDSQGKFIT